MRSRHLIALALALAVAVSADADRREPAALASSVGGVHLVAATGMVTCQRNADFMRFPIPCPGILPSSFQWVSTNGIPIGPQGECDAGGNRSRLVRWYVFGATFPLGKRGVGHIVIASAPKPMSATAFVRSLVYGSGVHASIGRVAPVGGTAARVSLRAQKS